MKNVSGKTADAAVKLATCRLISFGNSLPQNFSVYLFFSRHEATYFYGAAGFYECQQQRSCNLTARCIWQRQRGMLFHDNTVFNIYFLK
jgi:hypothetical protein